MDYLRSILLRLLFFILFFPVALGGAELFVWTFKGVGEARTDTVQTWYMPARLRGNYRGNVFGLPFVTNRYGFRGEPDFDVEPADGTYRILALGDSVGVGLGIQPSQHYVKVLERELNDRVGRQTRRFHVINAAGQGYSPSSYFTYLKYEGLKLSPRLVIIEIELSNDVTDEALLRWEMSSSEGGPPRAVRGGRYAVAWDGNLLGTFAQGPYFFERTYTYTLLLRRVLTVWDQKFPNPLFSDSWGATYFHLGFDRALLREDRIERGWQRLFSALEFTRLLLDGNGIPLLLLVLPSRYVFEGSDTPSRRFARNLLERAVGLARSRGIAQLTATQELAEGGGDALYFDFAHPTAEGNRIIGEKLADHLVDRLR